MTCSYSNDAHYTKGAAEYHAEKCVTQWMARMSDTQQCVEYMAGIGRTNPAMQGCSVTELEQICEQKMDTFTVDDARALCKEINLGHYRFWSERAERKGT